MYVCLCFEAIEEFVSSYLKSLPWGLAFHLSPLLCRIIFILFILFCYVWEILHFWYSYVNGSLYILLCVCDSSIWMMKCIQMQVPFLTSVICHSFFFDFHQLDSRMALIYRTLSTFVCVCVNSVYLILHFICIFLIFQSPFCWTFLFAIVWNSIWFNLYLLSAA